MTDKLVQISIDGVLRWAHLMNPHDLEILIRVADGMSLMTLTEQQWEMLDNLPPTPAETSTQRYLPWRSFGAPSSDPQGERG